MSQSQLRSIKELSKEDQLYIRKHVSEITILFNKYLNKASKQKTLLILANKAKQFKYKSALAFLEHMQQNPVQYDSQTTQFSSSIPQTKIKTLEFKNGYKILVLDLNLKQRVVMLTYPENVQEIQKEAQYSFFIDQFIQHLKRRTDQLKVAVLISSITLKNYIEDKRLRDEAIQSQTKFIKGLFQNQISHYLLIQKTNEQRLLSFLTNYPQNYLIDQVVSKPCKKLQKIFTQSFFNVKQKNFTTFFRQDHNKNENISKMNSDQLKNLQSYILTATVPLFNQFKYILKKNKKPLLNNQIDCDASLYSSVSIQVPEQQIDPVASKYLENINKNINFEDIRKNGQIVFGQFEEDKQLLNYLKISNLDQIVNITNVQKNQKSLKNLQQLWAKPITTIKGIPQSVIQLYFLSQFTKICKYFQEKQFLFGSSQDQQVQLLRTCIKALCSLANLINSQKYIQQNQLICLNLCQYYSFIDSLFNQLMVLKKLYNSTLAIKDLMKSLISLFIRPQRVILNKVLKNKIQKKKPVQYYDILLKIIQDNISSMNGKQNGQDVFKSKCFSYRMDLLLKRCQYQILAASLQQEDYETIQFLVKIYNSKNQVLKNSEGQKFDFKSIKLKIAQLLQKTSHPKLALPLYAHLGRVLDYQTCLNEQLSCMNDKQQKSIFLLDHSSFFYKNRFPEKAKLYFQTVIEGTQNQETRNKGQKQLKKTYENKFETQQSQNLKEFQKEWIEQINNLKPEGPNWKKNFNYFAKHLQDKK